LELSLACHPVVALIYLLESLSALPTEPRQALCIAHLESDLQDHLALLYIIKIYSALE